MWSWEFNMNFSGSINNRLSREQNYLWQMKACVTAVHELRSDFLFQYLPLLGDWWGFSTAQGDPGWPQHLYSSQPDPWDQLQHLNRAARPPRRCRAPLPLSTWKISLGLPGSSEGRAVPWLHSRTQQPPGQRPCGALEKLPPDRTGPALLCNSSRWLLWRRLLLEHGLWGQRKKDGKQLDNESKREARDAIRCQRTGSCEAEGQTVQSSLCSSYMCKCGATDDDVKLCIFRRNGF